LVPAKPRADQLISAFEQPHALPENADEKASQKGRSKLALGDNQISRLDQGPHPRHVDALARGHLIGDDGQLGDLGGNGGAWLLETTRRFARQSEGRLTLVPAAGQSPSRAFLQGATQST
jgi:hypothetical protein